MITRRLRHPWALRCGLPVIAVLTLSSTASAEYWKAGWSTDLSTLFHDVSGTVTILDSRTLWVENFNFDGGGPQVYFYLGADESDASFAVGLELQPQLTRVYDNESLLLKLPVGETLDDYNAISVWCRKVDVNFGSGTFALPEPAVYAKRGWTAVMPLGAHNSYGVVTVITERLLFVQSFTYDGTAPAVYLYLGATDTNADFENGIPASPLLDRAYNVEDLIGVLPPGETMDDWGAISVWCEAFSANFTSTSIDGHLRGDMNCDGVVGFGDINPFVLALTDPAGYDAAYPDCESANGDLNGDGSFGFDDINPFVYVLTS